MKTTDLPVILLTSLTLAFAGSSCSSDPAAEGGPMDASPDTSPDGGTDAQDDVATDATDAADVQIDGPDGALPVTCVVPASADVTGTDVWDDVLGQATVAVHDREACHRTYTLATTAVLRHAGDRTNPRDVEELVGWPTLRSGHDMLDALYAMTLQEVRENSVDAIHDYGFNDGASVPCGDGGCFETGRLWNYVWTRDTAYAVDLGLAAMDPTRSRNSLGFKLSERREGGDLQIVQDTGSGGSYPVSTDRVAWAVGAWELLRHLEGPAREAFRDRALEALRNTLEHDREVVFDPSDGLYRGEQSFLDWREQTYPAWTSDDVVHIGMSKSLSTNLLHFRALELASALAGEVGDDTARDRYRGLADDLRDAIQDRLWLEEEGLFSTYVTTSLDPAPVRRYDLLGSALAVTFGVATPPQATRILASYPHYGHGAPVIWPQQQQTPIYHNRGEWPFVTAYWLRAAKAAHNDTVAARMVRALVRGAAVNLSHMENFEASSGAAWLDDGDASGPVVNSERQLWSVASFLSMVHHTLFGLEATDDGLHVRPFVPASLRAELLGGADAIVLNDFPYRGRFITIVLHLPSSAGTGTLAVQSLRLDGQPLTGDFVPLSSLADQSRLDVELGAGKGPAAGITIASDDSWQNVFGPRTPSVAAIDSVTEGLRLTLASTEAADVSLRIYRDGVVVADELPGSTTSWTDDKVDFSESRSPCYVAEATFLSSGNHSQHSRPVCFWGTGGERVTSIPASAFVSEGGVGSSLYGRFHYEQWGDEGHTLTVPQFVSAWTGPHLVQLAFGNGAGPINTGITCAVKRVVVEDTETDEVVGSGIVMMPHLGSWDRWSASSFVPVNLEAGRTYRVVVRGDDRAVNMSSFAHFEAYTGGLGGSAGVFGRVNISDVWILAK